MFHKRRISNAGSTISALLIQFRHNGGEDFGELNPPKLKYDTL